MKKTSLLSLAVLLFASAARAEELRERDLFERWLRASPEVASFRMQVGAARFDVVTAGLLPNPNVQLFTTHLFAGENVNGKGQYGGQLTVPLPIFGQVGARKAAAEAFVTVAEVSVRQAIWQRAGDIQLAMLERAYAGARVEMLDQNLGELGRISQLVQTRAQAGANSAYDVLRVQTQDAAMRASLDNARIERDRAEAGLLALIGDASLAAAPITVRGLQTLELPEDEAALMQLALARRPDLELARRGASASDLVASAQHRSAWPVPSVFVNGTGGAGPEFFYFTAGLAIDLPVFARNQGAIGRAENEAESQRALARGLEARVRFEVQGGLRAWRSAKQALADYRAKGVASANELISRAELTYQAGSFRIAELFDAYRAAWEARAQELEIQRQIAGSEAALARACALYPL